MNKPSAFISYSWDSDEHRDWVQRLADDLDARGVDAWLDRKVVRLGDDVTQFMEEAVVTADYVLLVCTGEFGRKANDRTGGVGYEQSILTAYLLNAQQPRGRVFCVLRSGLPSVAIPRYMQSRVYADMREDKHYERELEQLVVHLLQKNTPPKSDIASPGDTDVRETKPGEPLGPPQYWALVAGSGEGRSFTPRLAELSAYLGAQLGHKKYGLVTGGWPGVDEAVARAFVETAEGLQIEPEDRLIQVVVNTEEPALTAGQVVFVSRGEEEWTEPVRRAHAVILLGGVGGTLETGRTAIRMMTPVLPIPDSGGDAKRLYFDILRNWDDFGWMGLSQSEFQRLGRIGTAGIDAALDLLPRKARTRDSS